MNNLLNKLRSRLYKGDTKEKRVARYISNGRVPWSEGYEEHKRDSICEYVGSEAILDAFKKRKLPENFGLRLDERIVEYPWIFSKLSPNETSILDAGSTFNYMGIVDQRVIKKKQLTIYTFYPEDNCYFRNRISYVFGDLREMYFKDASFDEIVSQSTIEHIDMDNSIYGYGEKAINEQKSYEYLKAVSEMIRLLKPNGKLLLTFPYGKYENHGFFQQFDQEMLQRILNMFTSSGTTEVDYFKYEKDGWRFASQEELLTVESFNPHTGKGKGDDGAAHCRSIACIEFIKGIK